MNGQINQRNASLEELLQAGKQALSIGDHESAHNLLRAAAVANPYDERVWMSLLDVLTPEEDREVCLENIIAINPLNPDARRELRAIRRERRQRDEMIEQPPAPAPRTRRTKRVQTAPVKTASVRTLPAKAAPKPSQPKNEQGVLARAIMTGIAIGLFAVVLGIVVSIVAYGGVLPIVVPKLIH